MLKVLCNIFEEEDRNRIALQEAKKQIEEKNAAIGALNKKLAEESARLEDEIASSGREDKILEYELEQVREDLDYYREEADNLTEENGVLEDKLRQRVHPLDAFTWSTQTRLNGSPCWCSRKSSVHDAECHKLRTGFMFFPHLVHITMGDDVV